jgi:FAD/FMN-containing dehydrogenase
MIGYRPDDSRERRQASSRTLSRRAMLRGATATTLGLASGAQLCPTTAQTPAPNSALGDLQARLTGQLLLPQDGAFLAANTPANLRYQDVLPMAIARCANEADVIACVQWCAESGVEPVVRGGGYSYAGLSTTTGLLIDLRALNTVTVDQASGTMTVGGGATIAQILSSLADGPLILPTGSCPAVGIGGLALGGGIGYDTRWAGLTCDHIRQTRIITADGTPLEVNATQYSDLYWALRGGAGGNYGTNTTFTFDLVEVPASPVTNFSITWRGADAAGLVMRAFQVIIQDAPPAFGAAVDIIPRDPAQSGKRRSIDVVLRGQFIGSESDLRDLLAPLLDLKTPPIEQAIAEMPYWESQQQLLQTGSDRHAYADISRFASAPLPDDVVSKIVSLLVNCPHRTDTAHGAITIFGWVGGVLTGTPRDATAYVHRDMTALWRVGAVWSADVATSVSEQLSAWTKEVVALIAPHTPDESYQNFPNRELVDWQQQYYAENLQRLIEVKQAYDPGNLFRNAQSIPASPGI